MLLTCELYLRNYVPEASMPASCVCLHTPIWDTTERVTRIFKEMERAVNQYESALATFSKKAHAPQRNNLPKTNGIFGKLGNYAMSLFGPNAAPDTAAPNARIESQTATSARAAVPAQVPNQEKKKQALPRRIPKFLGRPSNIITRKHIAEV